MPKSAKEVYLEIATKLYMLPRNIFDVSEHGYDGTCIDITGFNEGNTLLVNLFTGKNGLQTLTLLFDNVYLMKNRATVNYLAYHDPSPVSDVTNGNNTENYSRIINTVDEFIKKGE